MPDLIKGLGERLEPLPADYLPEIVATLDLPELVALSQAISMKRIADALEHLVEVERTLATPIKITTIDPDWDKGLG